MLFHSRKSVTLIELLIAVMLLAVMILAVNNINVFSLFQLTSADRRVKVQNDVSHCLDHMSKNLSRTIGNEEASSADSAIDIWPNSANTAILAGFVDYNNNGLSDAADKWASYEFDSSSHTLTYCGQCSGASSDSCQGACAAGEELLARDITAFSASKNFSQGNFVIITLTGCFDPVSSIACGASDNPSVTMSSSIPLPSVSTS